MPFATVLTIRQRKVAGYDTTGRIAGCKLTVCNCFALSGII